jgi:hypothetical protein
MASEVQSSSAFTANFPILYEGVIRELDGQYDQVKSLDLKTSFVLGAGSAVLAGAGALEAVALSHSSSLKGFGLSMAHAAGAGGVLTYLLIVLSCALSYRIQKFKMVPDPIVAEQSLDAPPERVQRGLMSSVTSSYSINQKAIDRKVFWAKLSLWALLAEGVLLAVAVLPQVV